MIFFRVLAVYVIVFTQMLDTSIANLSLVHISTDLGIDVFNASWVITSFGTGLAVAFPLAILLRMQIGERRLFFMATAGFVLTSWLCGVAENGSQFVMLRFLQGGASGIIVVLSQSLFFQMLGDHRRGLAIGIWGSAISLAPFVGPLLGAFITDIYGWRWLFFINVPIISIALIPIADFIEGKVSSEEWQHLNLKQIRTFSFYVGFILCSQLVVDLGDRYHWFESVLIRLTSLGAAVFAVLFFISNKQRAEIFDLSVFKDKSFSCAMVILCGANGFIFLSLLILPIWLQSHYGMPIMSAAMLVSVGSLIAGVFAPIVGHIMPKNMNWIFLGFCYFFLAASFFMMAQFQLDTGINYIVASRVVAGFGLALFSTSVMTLAFSQLKQEKLVNANAISMSLRIVSSNLAVAVGFFSFKHLSEKNFQTTIASVYPSSKTSAQGFSEMAMWAWAITDAMTMIFFFAGLLICTTFAIVAWSYMFLFRSAPATP